VRREGEGREGEEGESLEGREEGEGRARIVRTRSPVICLTTAM